jgi:hypothetical protein
MPKLDDMYKYIAVYVDGLAIAMKNPKVFVGILEKKNKFKTKGTGPFSFHLGPAMKTTHYAPHQLSTLRS